MTKEILKVIVKGMIGKEKTLLEEVDLRLVKVKTIRIGKQMAGTFRLLAFQIVSPVPVLPAVDPIPEFPAVDPVPTVPDVETGEL